MTGSNGSSSQPTSLVPGWAWVLAALVFVGGTAGLLFLFHAHESNPPSLVFRVPFSAFIAFFPALWVLVIGHVNQDARRRGLNRWVWTLVALLTPNALGVVFYYVYVWQRPLRSVCSECGTLARLEAQFCARCGHRLQASCPGCGKAVAADDAFCVSCGRTLET